VKSLFMVARLPEFVAFGAASKPLLAAIIG